MCLSSTSTVAELPVNFRMPINPVKEDEGELQRLLELWQHCYDNNDTHHHRKEDERSEDAPNGPQ